MLQLNDDEGVTPLLVSALDALVNGRELDTVLKTADRDKPLVYKLRVCVWLALLVYSSPFFCLLLCFLIPRVYAVAVFLYINSIPFS